MYHVISKSLYFLLNPVTWVFILLILALVKPKWRKKLLWVNLILVFLAGNEFVYRKMVVLWETGSRAYSQIPAAETAFVMGGLLNVEEHLGQFDFTDNVDRALVPLYLMREGRLKQMVVSGGRNDDNHPGYNNYQMFKEFMGGLGADTSNIYVETQARNSYENAKIGKEFMQQKGILKEPVLLVTTALHMRRSAACFKKQGVQVIPVAVDASLPNPDDKRNLGYYLWPKAEIMDKWATLLKEIVGLITYKILGYC